MKLYKYRDLREPSGLERLEKLLRTKAFWCARPDTLNDPQEFAWTCDYTPSLHTARLLTELLVRLRGHEREQIQSHVEGLITAGRLRDLAKPTVASMIHQCRDEIGLACFGSTADNETLWERYAGRGAGVCIEVELPDNLLGTQLHVVQYWDRKVIHIDTLLRSRLDTNSAAQVYVLSLLSKPSCWAPETEIRFVSKSQNVGVVVDGSAITCVVLGEALKPKIRERIRGMVPKIPLLSRECQQNGLTTC